MRANEPEVDLLVFDEPVRTCYPWISIVLRNGLLTVGPVCSIDFFA
jgi:hypothetical protein